MGWEEGSHARRVKPRPNRGHRIHEGALGIIAVPNDPWAAKTKRRTAGVGGQLGRGGAHHRACLRNGEGGRDRVHHGRAGHRLGGRRSQIDSGGCTLQGRWRARLYGLFCLGTCAGTRRGGGNRRSGLRGRRRSGHWEAVGTKVNMRLCEAKAIELPASTYFN